MMTLREARKSVRLTQGDVAKIGGVTVNTISRWERGLKELTFIELAGLCQIYGVRTSDILLPAKFAESERYVEG